MVSRSGAARRLAMWPGVLLAVLLVVLLAVAMVAGGSGRAQAAAGGVRPLPAGAAGASPGVAIGTTPTPASALGNMSCAGRSFCMALGRYTDPSGTIRSMAQAWNGQAWRVVATPPGTLDSVSCVTARFCMAVGTSAAVWDGAYWHALPESPGGAEVSCSRATFCMAVRLNGADSWNGKTWDKLALSVACDSLPTYPCTEGFTGLTCTTTRFCMAVGSVTPGYPGNDTVPLNLAEQWNGVKWAQISIPNPDPLGDGSSLSSLSCTSSAFCIAAGFDDEVLTWNGGAWSTLNGGTYDPQGPLISCVASDRCYLLNGPSGFESWIDGTWQTVPSAPVVPSGASGITASALSCTGTEATQCTMIGSYSPAAVGGSLTLAEQWTGGGWQLTRTPNPGDLFDGLMGTSCTGSSFCVAVGSYQGPADGQHTLAEAWNGHRWRLLYPSSPGVQISYLTSVSCPSRTECVAVGATDDKAGSWQTLAEEWAGGAWKVLPSLNPGPNDQFTSVSCPTTTDCMMVGSSHDFTHADTSTLAERWREGTWQVVATPDPGSNAPTPRFNILSGVSCTGPSWCMAVGDMDERAPLYSGALAMRWDGTSWDQVPATNPGGDLELEAVSCSKAARCVAAGRYVQDVHGSAPGQAIRPAADAWDGTAWTVRKLPQLAPGETGQLNGVSCGPAAGCMAVGEYITTVGDVRELADAWTGQNWSSVKVTSLSSVFSDLAGIDCTGASRCLAVGEVTTQRALSALWDGSAWRSENAIDP